MKKKKKPHGKKDQTVVTRGEGIRGRWSKATNFQL